VSHIPSSTVRRATRTWTQIKDTNRLLQERLLTGSTPVPGVNRVGIGMSEDDFVIHVGVDQYDEDVVAAIRAAAAPTAVVVTQKPRPHRSRSGRAAPLR